MNITITIKNNSKEIVHKVDIDPDMKIKELYNWALKQGFIPYIKNAIWHILCDRTCKMGVTMSLLVYSENKNKCALHVKEDESLCNFCEQWKVYSFIFDYYSSPAQYAKQLFWAYACNKTNIFRDGGYDEYILCDVTPEMEEEWTKEFKSQKNIS